MVKMANASMTGQIQKGSRFALSIPEHEYRQRYADAPDLVLQGMSRRQGGAGRWAADLLAEDLVASAGGSLAKDSRFLWIRIGAEDC